MFCGLQSSVMKINVRHQLSFPTTIFWQAATFQQILVLEGECLWSPDNASKILGWGVCVCVQRFWFQKRGTQSVTRSCHGGHGPFPVSPGGVWRKPLCCSSFPEVFRSYINQPLSSVRHGISLLVAARTNSTCIFTAEVIMDF